MKLAKIIPWAAGAVSLAIVAGALRPPSLAQGFDLEAAGRLPVLEGGRVKPLDSVARNALLMIRSKQRFSAEVPAADGKTVAERFTAVRWLLEVLFRPEAAATLPVFYVDNPDLLGMLHKEQESSRPTVAYQALEPQLEELQQQASVAQQVEAPARTPFQRAVLNLYERVWLYTKLTRTMQLPGATLAAEIQAVGTPGIEQDHRLIEQWAQFRPLPPAAGAGPEDWRSVGGGLAGLAQGKTDPILAGWARAGQAWAKQDAPAFNQAVRELSTLTRAAVPAATRQGVREQLFNRSQPFYLGMILFVLSLLLLFVSWLWRPEAFRRGAFVVLCAAALVHTAGLAARIVLQGRPPVTNLYSSAVMVGWVAVVVGIILEGVYRRGFGTLVSGAIGFGTLIVAHHLADQGDTMEMMRAVLDSNFWLATHVITIIIGYGGTFLAGLLAIVAAVYRHLAPGRDRGDDRVLGVMIYGTVCFALFFSFVGTVLGGIWADQSWGRFWGWDPKENGALLIVLWNAIILHARWGGYAGARGIAAMAIFGNIITACSWFGVNMLGVGLHSYGFMDEAFLALAGFTVSQLVFMVVALMPDQFWKASAWSRTSPDPAKSA